MTWLSPKCWWQSIFAQTKKRESRTDVHGNVISKGHLFVLTKELGPIEFPAKRVRSEGEVIYQVIETKLPDDAWVTGLRLPADGTDHLEVRVDFEKPCLISREEKVGWVIYLSLNSSGISEAKYEVRRYPPGYLGYSGLFLAIREGDSERVNSVLKMGADPSQKDSHHFTPLHSAALRKELEIVSLLLDAGANVHAESSGGMGDELDVTPLHEAVRGGSLAIVKRLLSAGADIDAECCIFRKGHRPKTALDIARELEFPEMEAFLRSAGAKTFEDLERHRHE